MKEGIELVFLGILLIFVGMCGHSCFKHSSAQLSPPPARKNEKELLHQQCFSYNYTECLNKRLECLKYYNKERCNQEIFVPCTNEAYEFCKVWAYGSRV